MIQSSKALYWLYALRIIDVDCVISWADDLISMNIKNDSLFYLSTCRNDDPNEIMAELKKINYKQESTIDDLLGELIDYYKKVDDFDIMNTSILFDFAVIDDIPYGLEVDLRWLEDEVCLIRDGSIPCNLDIRDYILNSLEKLRAAQQSDASETMT
jgi:hypothetical protein